MVLTHYQPQFCLGCFQPTFPYGSRPRKELMSISNSSRAPKKSKTVPESKYTRHMIRAGNTGGYFQFRRDYVLAGILTHMEALFLQDLINHASMKENVNGWFLCTVKYLISSLKWEENTQRHFFRSLIEKKFIKVKRKGMPAMRYVKILIGRIEEAIDVWYDSKKPSPVNTNGTGSVNNNGTGPNNTNGTSPVSINCEINKKTKVKREKKEDCPPPTAGDKVRKGFYDEVPLSPDDQFDLDCARQLYKAVSVVRKSMRHNTSDKDWAKQFKLLRKDLHNDKELLKSILDWYCPLVGKDKMPEAFSATSFRNKWDQIISAKRRESKITHKEFIEDITTW